MQSSDHHNLPGLPVRLREGQIAAVGGDVPASDLGELQRPKSSYDSTRGGSIFMMSMKFMNIFCTHST